MWWKQTGAGATRGENKCLKASLCPSCWAGCCPQQKLPWQDDVPGKRLADHLMRDRFIDVLPGNVSRGLFWGFFFFPPGFCVNIQVLARMYRRVGVRQKDSKDWFKWDGEGGMTGWRETET